MRCGGTTQWYVECRQVLRLFLRCLVDCVLTHAHITSLFCHQVNSRIVTHKHQPKHSHGKRSMATIEEQIAYRSQRMNWMHTDVAELQNGLEGPATRYAELMVQLVTSAPRVKRVVEAGASSHVTTAGYGEREVQVGRRTPPRGSGVRKRQTTSHTCGAASRSQHSRSNCRTGSDHSMTI